MTNKETVQTGGDRVPWILAASFLVVYTATLNWWTTWESLPVIAKATGWDGEPQYHKPLLYLLMLPARILPAAWQPILLNAMSAVLASLTIFLLARSVQLLPNERTREQRVRKRTGNAPGSGADWMPSLLACLVCGFQLSFWEHATSMTGEMLSLFLFAYILRCLLEFRASRNNRWLHHMALIYGLSIPNDWIFITYFPILFLALVWMKGLRTFQLRFLFRMAATGAAGLVLYLLMPLIVLMQDPMDEIGIWELIKMQLGGQKHLIVSLPPMPVILLSMVSLLPIAVMGIRFHSMNDMNNAGQSLSNSMFRIMHLLILGLCIWIAFDPLFSPRGVSRSLSIPIDYITFNYLGALAIGYFFCYTLLVFGQASSRTHKPSRFRHRRSRMPSALIAHGARALVVIALIAIPAGLVFKNLPAIHWNNGRAMADFGELLIRHLPEERSLILADDPSSVLLARSSFVQQGRENPHVFLIPKKLQDSLYYQRHVLNRIRDRFPELREQLRTTESLNLYSLIGVIQQATASGLPAGYLNYSYGLYFELYHPVIRGLFSAFHPYPDDELLPPGLSGEQIASNRDFWKELEEKLMGGPDGSPRLGIRTARHLGLWCSREYNCWGVALQQEGKLPEAEAAFESALRWNPDNLSAQLNLRQNRILQGREGDAPEMTSSERLMFERHGGIEGLLARDGLADTHEIRVMIAQIAQRPSPIPLRRQAILNYLRAAQIDPARLGTRLNLADQLIKAGFPEMSLEWIGGLRDKRDELSPEQATGLVILEAWAHGAIGNKAEQEGNADLEAASYRKVEEILISGLEEDPNNERILENLFLFHLVRDAHEKAIALLDSQLELHPEHAGHLLNKSTVLIRADRFDDAVRICDRILEMDPDNQAARLNRAVAHLQSGKHELAMADYEVVEQVHTNHFKIHYGLGRIAMESGEIETATDRFRKYQEVADPRDEKYQEVAKALEALQNP